MRRSAMAGCTLLAAFAMLAAPAHATGVPSPANSTVPACISLVGHVAGVPARGLGEFTVIVRDLANNPVQGAAVTVDLSAASDLVLASDQLDPDAVVDCAQHRVTKFSDVNGVARFTLIGGSKGAGAGIPQLSLGKIYQNGVLIGSPTASAFDLDGVGGVGANDLSVWIEDFGSTLLYGRSDYDCSGNVGANDLSMWLNAFGSMAMTQSGAAACP